MKKILLVEDTEDVAQLMSAILQREGYKVDVAYDGRKALEILEKDSSYNLIITDLLMPNLDGMGLAIKVKEHYGDIPVIVISGGGVTLDARDALKAVEDKVFAVMSKPVDFDEMLSKVESAILK